MWALANADRSIVGEHYTSIGEFFGIQRQRPFNAAYRELGDSKICGEFDTDEEHVADLRQTHELVLEGTHLFDGRFREAYARLSPALLDLEAREELGRARRAWDVVGTSVSVPRALAGCPRAMGRRVEPRRERTVRICYSLSCAWLTPTAVRVRAGCALLAIVQLLERSGYRVCLSWAITRFGEGATTPSICCEIELKPFGSLVDPYAYGFLVAAESPLFHVGSWWMNRFPDQPCVFEGEGTSVTYDPGRDAAMRAWMRSRGVVWLAVSQIVKDLECDPARMLDFVFAEQRAIERGE